MKKLTVGLAALLSGYAANSLAALPTGTSKCDVCVPSYCGGFTFGLTGLYWRPSSPQLDYGLSYPASTGASNLFHEGNIHSVDHDYDWGFKANIGYVFPSSGNDVNLTYTHWDNDDNDHTNNFRTFLPGTSASLLFDEFDLGEITFAPIQFTGTVDDPVTDNLTATVSLTVPVDQTNLVDVKAKSRFQNHTWDLDFGQAINVGCNFKLRWFGGLRYTRLEHDLDVTHEFRVTGTGVTLDPVGVVVTLTPVAGGPATTVGAGITPVVDIAATIRDIVHQKSDFDGIGPRFGFDASYHLGGGFGVAGSLSTALLVGEHEATFSERVAAAGAITVVNPALTTITIADATITGPTGAFAAQNPPETISFKHPDETRVVPNIDAKLGLDWTYQFCNCSRSKLTIEAGYMVSHYFNAIDRLSGAEAIAPSVRSRHTIDTSFDGPYVGVQVNL